jgi:RNA-directed DNA polymerase
LGFKALIKPSKESIRRQVVKVGKIIEAHKSAPQEALIRKLNPVIKGWANYYATAVSKEIFSALDSITVKQLLAWGKRTHPGTPVNGIVRKCWQTVGNRHWIFATNEGIKTGSRLLTYAETPIVRHTKVKGNASPYDGNLVYWSTRRCKHPECPKRIAELLRQQEGKCAKCKLHFREDDLLEIDHILSISQGGKDTKSNRQLLHRHCHDEKTALDALKLQRQTAYEELARKLDDTPW